MSLRATVRAAISARLAGTADFAIPTFDLPFHPEIEFSNGTGAGQANEMFSDRRTIAADDDETLDLSGVLSNALGRLVAFTAVKALMVRAAAGNTHNVVISPPAANAWVGPFGAAEQSLALPPGGVVVLVAPTAAGWPVVNSTGDLLNFANSGIGSPVTYDLIILGNRAP